MCFFDRRDSDLVGVRTVRSIQPGDYLRICYGPMRQLSYVHKCSSSKCSFCLSQLPKRPHIHPLPSIVFPLAARHIGDHDDQCLLLYNGLELEIKEEHGKGLGLFAGSQPIAAGTVLCSLDIPADGLPLHLPTVLGVYLGEEPRRIRDSTYVIDTAWGLFDGNPVRHPSVLGGVPVGCHGQCVISFMNEAASSNGGQAEHTNVRLVSYTSGRRLSFRTFKYVAPHTALWWCYARCDDRDKSYNRKMQGYKHSCTKSRCKEYERY